MALRRTLIVLLVAMVSACAGQSSRPAAHDAADVVFAQNMVPHHQQAVDMAALVPTRTANQTMHVIAANIAADQRAEIKALRGLLAQWGASGGGADMGGMAGMVDQATLNRLKSLDGPDFDQLWLTAMIGHHEGAITMAQAELAHGQNPDAVHLANVIIKAQQREIAYMSHLLSRPQ